MGPEGTHRVLDREEDVVVGDVLAQPQPGGVARRFAGRSGDREVDAVRVQLVDHPQEHATAGEVEVFDARGLEHEQAGRRRAAATTSRTRSRKWVALAKYSGASMR